jgi:hypothetical protein
MLPVVLLNVPGTHDEHELEFCKLLYEPTGQKMHAPLKLYEPAEQLGGAFPLLDGGARALLLDGGLKDDEAAAVDELALPVAPVDDPVKLHVAKPT